MYYTIYDSDMVQVLRTDTQHSPDENARPQRQFANLARRDDTEMDVISQQCRDELSEAKIEIIEIPIKMKGEVPTKVFGVLNHWGFTRSWRYWVAKGPGIPSEIATELHERYGQVVRVDGHCGCPSPKKMFGGFGVGYYHIDTQEGLCALAQVIAIIPGSGD